MFCMGLRMSSKATGPGTASILTAAIILIDGSAPNSRSECAYEPQTASRCCKSGFPSHSIAGDRCAVPPSWTIGGGRGVLSAGVSSATNLAEGHFRLGDALRGQGKFDEAVAAYRQAIGIKPDLVEAHS